MALSIRAVKTRDRNTVDWDGVSIETENALTGTSSTEWGITGAGDTSNVGFPRTFSTSVGSTVQFSCTGNGTILDIYRVGWYGGAGARFITRLTNTATSQPNPASISSSNGGTHCAAWSVTASWAIPSDAVSGFYLGVYRNAAQSNASWIPFVVHDDARPADILYKTSDSTWGVAYNGYGTPASPMSGSDFYGNAFDDVIGNRCHASSWLKPIVTRGDRTETYWMNAEAPMIRWLERNGYNVKYVSCQDIESRPSCMNNGGIFLSSGHDEYWSQNMRDNVAAFRDTGKHLIFMSGNEVFWRTRMTDANTLWCFKDTMSGPGGHTAGTALDPVTWTGTWQDTRSANNATRQMPRDLTGTFFRQNGPLNTSVTFQGAAGYASHVAWRNTSVASGSDVTVQGIIGYEADAMDPQRPGAVTLASKSFSINGNYSDDNGGTYNNNGTLNWGVVSQRYSSGATVIGFGTCQWAWGLDDTHDNGGNYANTTMRQFTYNILRDLGAAPATLMAGLTASSPSALTNYGSTA